MPVRLNRVGGKILLHLKAVPRSSRNEISGTQDDRLKAEVTTLPVDSSGNEVDIHDRKPLPSRD